jgi:capreomycidine synthase
MDITRAHLEDWMRAYYFSAEIDIGSSGVQNFSMAELRDLVGFSLEDFDGVVFDDSPSCGKQSLRQAIADRWGDGNPEKVLTTHGSSEVIFLIMNALLEAGDEVVVLNPCYHALRNIAEYIGCHLREWNLRFEDQFVPDIAEAKKLINAKTRMVVVNFPHNPTGATLTAEQQRELIEAVSEVNAYLVWDAAFSELVYESAPLPDPVLTYERAISLGTLSKAYGLAGLRVGWCLAAPELLERFVLWRDYTTLYLSPLIEAVAERAIENADSLRDVRLTRARRNLEILAHWIRQHREFVEWVRPKGGVTAFVRMHGVDDIEEFCHRLGQEQGVMLVPGSCFNNPGFARFGFGGPTADLEEGLARVSLQLNACTAPYLDSQPHQLTVGQEA